MRRYTIALAAFAWALVKVPACPAATSDVVLYANLLIEPGGRAGGLGKTFTGVADDPLATYYNAGGLALQEHSAISFMHEPRNVAGTDAMFMDYVAGSFRTRYGTFALAVNYLNAGKSDRADDQGQITGTIHSYYADPSLFWSYEVLPNLGVGAGLTYAYQHLTDEKGGTADTPLASVGVLYRTPLKGLNAGLAANNLWADEKRGEASYQPPRQGRLGVSYLAISNEKNDLLVAADVSKLLMNFREKSKTTEKAVFDIGTEICEAVYTGGVEYTYAKIISVRTGYYYDFYGEMTGLTLGAGIAYRKIGFDYARIPEGGFGEQNRFGVNFVF